MNKQERGLYQNLMAAQNRSGQHAVLRQICAQLTVDTQRVYTITRMAEDIITGVLVVVDRQQWEARQPHE